MKIFLIMILASVLLPGPAPGAELPRADVDTIPNTVIVLPVKKGIRLRWVVPPLDIKEAQELNWKNLAFGVDEKENPWVGHDRRFLINSLQNTVFTVDQPYENVVWTENNGIILSTQRQMGYLDVPAKTISAQDGSPTMNFKAGVELPYPGMRMRAAWNNTVYFWGQKIKTSRYEVFLIQSDGEKPKIRNLISEPHPVTAVSGDGQKTYIAMGPTVVLLEGNKSPQGYFKHPDEDILELELYQGAGLFYATKSEVGFIGRKQWFNFLKTPEPHIQLRNKKLYILVSNSLGVLRIEGADLFDGVERPVMNPEEAE